tara:strand:+ start:275 stop:511 length:237 start_codon:yes stop_codon:yes gene_type:complete
MNTLYDRLKPEYKQMLEEQEEKYPSLIKSVVISLKENYLWNHLTLGQAKELISFTDISYGNMSSYDWSFGDKFFVCED